MPDFKVRPTVNGTDVVIKTDGFDPETFPGDHKVAADSSDGYPSTLIDKIIAGAGITVTYKNNPLLDYPQRKHLEISAQNPSGLYVPIEPLNVLDSTSSNWGTGVARNVGTYTFRPEDNSYAWPADAIALHMFMYSQWATASNSSILSLRRSSGGSNEAQVRALVASVGYGTNANIALGGSGYFYANIANANSMSSVLRVLGYYI